MRLLLAPSLIRFTSSRHIRQRRAPPPTRPSRQSGYSRTDSRISAVTTYADTHTMLTDPWASAPYPRDDLQRLFDRNVRTEERAKKGDRRPLSDELTFYELPIERRSIVLFPGQGSQYVGMGASLLACPGARNLFDAARHILGYDLLELCLSGPKAKLDQTMYCQPAVFVASLAAIEKLRVDQPDVISTLVATAGFSVGEYAALVLAGSIDFDQALTIVQARATAMQKCTEQVPSGMITVRYNQASRLKQAMYDAECVSGDSVSTSSSSSSISHRRHRSKHLAVCSIANYLYTGVCVIGGAEPALQFLEASAAEYGFHIVKRLAVSGAFHTWLMRDAEKIVADQLQSCKIRLPNVNVYSNATGRVYERKVEAIRNGLVAQICSPVKWHQIQELLSRHHVDGVFPRYFEVGPGRQLAAMFYHINKRAHKCLTNVTA